MKRSQMILFFAVFFSIYGLVNFYIFLRGWQALSAAGVWRTAYAAVFIFLSLSFIAGRWMEKNYSGLVSEVLVWTGSFWLAAMLYGILALLVIDLARLVNALLPWYPRAVTENYVVVKTWLLIGIVSTVAVILATGHLNARMTRVREMTIAIPKAAGGRKSLKIAAASDIHLGTIIGRKRLAGFVEKINALDADLVLLPGDIVDEDLAPVIRENLGETLLNIRSRLGVYAVTGNHEYIGGAEQACAYLSAHGVTLLRDQAVTLEGEIVVAGREDRSSRGFAGKGRKSYDEILRGIDRQKIIIGMDHQPFHLEEAEAAGVDFQLSGHTHHGQLWPFNYITDRLYEMSWGYARRGGAQYYVSSGAGTWGPPVRIGNSPEILSITLTFQQD